MFLQLRETKMDEQCVERYSCQSLTYGIDYIQVVFDEKSYVPLCTLRWHFVLSLTSRRRT